MPIEVHIEYFIGSKDIYDLTVDDKPLGIGDNHIKYVQCIRTYRNKYIDHIKMADTYLLYR